METIKKEDIAEDLAEASTVNKPLKKMAKLSDKMIQKLNGMMEAERSVIREKISSIEGGIQTKISSFISSTNDSLSAYKKRLDAMYADLVRRFCVNLEDRVHGVEFHTKASLEIMAIRLYRIESKSLSDGEKLPEFSVYLEAMISDHQVVKERLVNEFVDKIEAQEKENAKGSKEMVEARTKNENSGEPKGTSSDSSNQEDNRA